MLESSQIRQLQMREVYKLNQTQMAVKQLSYSAFCSEYKLIRREKDYHLGEHILMRSNSTKRLAIVKNHECQSVAELQAILNDYSNLAKMYAQTHNLCAFLGYSLEESRGILSINLIYDYHQNTLDEEIAAMLRKNEKFTQRQLDCFILSCIKALAVLEKYGLNHLCLKYTNILIEGRGTIDLIFRIFHTPYLSTSVEEIRQNKTNIQVYNLAQNQLQFLNSNRQKNEADLDMSERLKIDKESLGLLVIRMATLDQKHGIYTINQKNQIIWDLPEIKARIERISKNYSREFTRKIQYLLLDPNFSGFNDIPSYVTVGIRNSNQSSHSRLKKSNQKQVDASSKSPSKHESGRKYLDITSSKVSLGQRESRVSHSNEPFNVSSIARVRGESLENSKSSIGSKSPSAFNSESPSKIKSKKYEELKQQIERTIFIEIEKEQAKQEIKDDGVEYVGGIKNNRKNGYGICYYKQGDIYAGQWQNDRIEGTGSYLFHNCDLYRGGVKGGLKHGQGKYIYNNGNYYEGEWKNDRKDGYGVYYNKERNENYQGQWSNGAKQGEGIYRWKNGDKYEGGFTQDFKSGSGVATKLDGTKITGQWYNDHLRGIASIKYRSGLTYTGEIQLGANNMLVLEGSGQEVTPEGTKYEGEYKDNKKNGFCKIQFKNGDLYEGNIRADKFDGFGTYFYNYLECTYSGEWKSGLHSGRGILEFKNGTKIEIPWVEGRPGEKGRILYANGDVYEGEVGRMGRNGKGVYQRADGQKIEGLFRNGVLVSQSRESVGR